MAERFSHHRSPAAGGLLAPAGSGGRRKGLFLPLLCHCTFAIRGGRAVVPNSISVGAGDGQLAAPTHCSKRGLPVSLRRQCSPAPCCGAQHAAFPLAAPKTLFKNTQKDILPLEKQPKWKTNPSFRHRIIYTGSGVLRKRGWANDLII